MKILSAFALSICFLLNAFSQCAEPTAEALGKPIVTRSFEVQDKTARSEQILTFEAKTENSSWGKIGAESATLTIFVDGKYNQDVLLFMGTEKFTYRALLGKFSAGKHKVTAVLNQSRSAKNIGQVRVSAFNVQTLTAKSTSDRFALENAPILYLRPETIDKFSDIPLLTYYEVFSESENSFKIRYTTIFTNEDGGTQTAALMARWGRGTDIEWVYEIDVRNGAITSEVIQGANHVTKDFKGKRLFGSHPAIFDATVNNNFADSGCSALRMTLLPLRADLSEKSRETVMDENAWTYRIMAEELMRENRVNPQNLGENTIADLRDYFYVEVQSEPQNSAIAIQMNAPDGKIISSDDGRETLRVNRPGFLRIALRALQIPRGKFPSNLAVSCYAAAKRSDNRESLCRNINVIKIIRLDENFRPQEVKLSNSPQNLKAGESAVFKISAAK